MAKHTYETYTTEVLVIGAGAAGMRAAISVAENDKKVAIATKGEAGRSGATPMACPSYQAVLEEEKTNDSFEIAFEDACYEGRYLGDEDLINVLVKEAPKGSRDLLSYGVKFRQTETGRFMQVEHPGQSHERNLVILGNGYAMASGLRREVVKHETIEVLEDTVVTKILSEGGGIDGAISINMRTGKPLVIKTNAIVIATGGYPELWLWTDTEPGLTGDGVWLGYQAGADLVDLEMMLLYPTGLCFPDEVEGTLVQYEGLLADKYCGGEMVNVEGGSVLPKSGELPVRDVMMKMMFQEIEAGRGTARGGLNIDLSKSHKNREEILEILNELDSLPYNNLSDLGIDILKEPIGVRPVTHYTLGGIRINTKGETTVEGLFAAGEVSGNVHGANRVSGNALAGAMVFGARAGASAAEYVSKANKKIQLSEIEVGRELDRLYSFLKEDGKYLRPIELKRKLKHVMHDYVNHRRDKHGLSKAVEMIEKMRQSDVPRLGAIRKPCNYNYEWEEAIEVISMLNLAELVAVSALEREESRGHHWRTDFPKMRREWEKHTVIRKSKDGYVVDRAPVVRLKDRTKDRRSADGTLVRAGLLDEYEEN